MGRWDIARVDGVHVVTMTSDRVNQMNHDCFGDLQAAIVELQSAEALPVVLTGVGPVFLCGARPPGALRARPPMGRGLADGIVPAATLLARAAELA